MMLSCAKFLYLAEDDGENDVYAKEETERSCAENGLMSKGGC